jgi:hypothetical protein
MEKAIPKFIFTKYIFYSNNKYTKIRLKKCDSKKSRRPYKLNIIHELRTCFILSAFITFERWIGNQEFFGIIILLTF